jgi:hypothetical protein
LKNGEKQMRAQLCRTPEWADAHAREAAAVRADASGMPELGVALRARDVTALRKRHFFALCRDWQLRSDVWRSMRDIHGRDDAAQPAAARAAAAGEAHSGGARQQHALACVPPRAPRAPPLGSQAYVTLSISRDLAPSVVAFARAVASPIMMAAASAEPRAPVKTLDLTTLLAVSNFGRCMGAQQRAVAAELRAASCALAAGGDGTEVAFRLGSRAPLLAETSVHTLLVLSHALSASCNDIYAHLPPLLGRGLSAPEAAHTAELMEACGAVLTFVARAQALLAQLRTGTGVAYLDAGALIVDQVAAVLDATARSAQGRLDAFEERLAREPHGWRHTFFEHAAAMGVKPVQGSSNNAR